MRVDEMVLAYSVFRTALADLDLEVHGVVSDAISCLAEGLDRRQWG